MLTKWFFGVNAKSKGYFNGFNGSPHIYVKDIAELSAIKKVDAQPSFTKQSALSQYSFSTEDEAIKGKQEMRESCEAEVKSFEDSITKFESYRETWKDMDSDDKSDMISEYGLTVGGGRYYWYGRGRKLRQEEIDAMDKVNWDFEILKQQKQCLYPQAKIKFIDEKLIVRESDIEIKFMEGERRSIQWINRGANETSGNYCCGCGGAVPDVPTLVIGKSKKQRYRDDLHICAICMSNLADEAKIQARKVSEEILEHYQTDRFLRSMD